MAERVLTLTTTSLLETLKNPGDTAWNELDRRYRPILESFARRLGLGSEEATELAQVALSEVFRAYSSGKYQRGRGRLSSWIIGIAHNKVRDRLEARRAREGASLSADLVDEGRLSALWEAEHQRAILLEALQTFRERTHTDDRTVQAFELVAVRGVPAASVAEQCGMSVDEVYVAKNRVAGRLRAIVEEIRAAYQEE